MLMGTVNRTPFLHSSPRRRSTMQSSTLPRPPRRPTNNHLGAPHMLHLHRAYRLYYGQQGRLQFFRPLSLCEHPYPHILGGDPQLHLSLLDREHRKLDGLLTLWCTAILRLHCEPPPPSPPPSPSCASKRLSAACYRLRRFTTPIRSSTTWASYATQGSNPRLADPSLLLTRLSLALDRTTMLSPPLNCTSTWSISSCTY